MASRRSSGARFGPAGQATSVDWISPRCGRCLWRGSGSPSLHSTLASRAGAARWCQPRRCSFRVAAASGAPREEPCLAAWSSITAIFSLGPGSTPRPPTGCNKVRAPSKTHGKVKDRGSISLNFIGLGDSVSSSRPVGRATRYSSPVAPSAAPVRPRF